MGFYNCSRTLEDGGLNPIKEAARYIGENYFCYMVQLDSSFAAIINETIPLKMYFNTRYSYTAAEDGKPRYGIIFEPFVIYPGHDISDNMVFSIVPLQKIVWDDINVIHDIDSIKRRITEWLTQNMRLLNIAGIKDIVPGKEFTAYLISLGNNPHILSNEFSISDFKKELNNFSHEQITYFVPKEENQN